MHLLSSLLSLNLFISSLILPTQANPWQTSDGIYGNKTTQHDDKSETERKYFENVDEKVLENPDFEDDDSDEFISLVNSDTRNVYSVTHLHQERGEILIPCFGMWWPVGGPTYDYIDDYYGDYKKKRRRYRKQKKSARMKKKKS